jgi:hypothetical protein
MVKKSVVLNILQQPCWPLVFAVACIFLLIKQRLFVRVVLSAFFVVVIVPTCTSFYAGGSLNIIPFVLFYTALYAMFRTFVFLGNRRATKIYEQNATMLNVKFTEMRVEYGQQQSDSFTILSCLGRSEVTGANACPRFD